MVSKQVQGLGNGSEVEDVPRVKLKAKAEMWLLLKKINRRAGAE